MIDRLNLKTADIAKASRRGLLVAAIFLVSAGSSLAEPVSDLTVELDGALLREGGAITIWHIPVSEADWRAAGDAGKTVRIDARYAEIQLRYPDTGTFTYRFRPVAGAADAARHATQVLSVIGTDMEGKGPPMTRGFADARSDGGRIIRIPSLDEITGPESATRSNARWGRTEGRDAVPPADERSTRSLVVVMEDDAQQSGLRCEGDDRVKVCTMPEAAWPAIDALWWRSIAETRLERLEHHALRRCYDSVWFREGTCEPDPQTDEPAYIHRAKP